MDFRFNTVLKEHYAFFVGDRDAHVVAGEQGLYVRDTRVLSRYAWHWTPADGPEPQTLVVATPRPDALHAHHAQIDGPSQTVALRRTLSIRANGLRDEVEVENTSRARRALSLELDVAADFADLFEARGWHHLERPPAATEVAGSALALRHTAGDDVTTVVRLDFGDLAAARPDGADWELSLAPGERVRLVVEVDVEHPLDAPPHAPLSYDTWRSGFAHLPPAPVPAVLERAIDDLRGLLLFTPDGPVPAAGIPWFVATFGRDALLTAHLLLPHQPDVAAGTLRHLARHQGTEVDAYRAEEPGKIVHEIRFGELARTGRVPHRAYYGTVDATPLFVTLLEAHRAATDDLALVRELRPAWEAALVWLTTYGDPDGDGFVEFAPAAEGEGLTVQSWKDSGDSMSHADGRLASGSLAVSEVQGYAYAAFRAAATWYALLGEPNEAEAWTGRAETLRARFHAAFWQEDLGTYAMALDGDKRPLRVRNSDAGQLLWTGIVPASHAARLVAGLMGPDLWTGWGLRTLGRGEARYNPVSYHNGSVWPHDTALCAAGFARYGFVEEAHRVRDALYDLAAAQPDGRLPELVGGYPRRRTSARALPRRLPTAGVGRGRAGARAHLRRRPAGRRTLGPGRRRPGRRAARARVLRRRPDRERAPHHRHGALRCDAGEGPEIDLRRVIGGVGDASHDRPRDAPRRAHLGHRRPLHLGAGGAEVGAQTRDLGGIGHEAVAGRDASDHDPHPGRGGHRLGRPPHRFLQALIGRPGQPMTGYLAARVAQRSDVDVVLHGVGGDHQVAHPQVRVHPARHAREHHTSRTVHQECLGQGRGLDLADAARGQEHVDAVEPGAVEGERSGPLLVHGGRGRQQGRHLLGHGADHRQRPLGREADAGRTRRVRHPGVFV